MSKIMHHAPWIRHYLKGEGLLVAVTGQCWQYLREAVIIDSGWVVCDIFHIILAYTMIALLKLWISNRSFVFLPQEWESKATKLKEEYAKAVKEYEASGGGGGSDSKEKKKDAKRKESTPKSSPVKSGNFKSKEYISDVDTSSSSEKDDGEDKKEKKVSKKPPAAKKPVSLL